MKKNLFGLLAILIAILLSAFSYQPVPQPAQVYYMWFLDATPSMENLITESQDPLTEDFINCEGQGNACEFGYLPSDFRIDGDPDSGLEPGSEPMILECGD